MNAQFKKGVLELIVLESVRQKDMYGYELVEEVSKVVDVTCRQSLGGKIFGTGDVIVKTRVDASPEIVLKNISRPLEIRRMISEAVEAARQSRNVVGKEFYGGPGAPPMVDLDGDGIPDFDERTF